MRLCPKASFYSPIASNDIPALPSEEEAEPASLAVSEKPLCVLCEYGMSMLEEKIINNRTLDMVEHAVQMLCSYMPR